MGIIPTDSLPAIVCDVGDRDAVERLYGIKNISPKKPLSILCRGFADIGTYTLGFPVSNVRGRRNTFDMAKRVLPGTVSNSQRQRCCFADASVVFFRLAVDAPL